MGEPIKGLFIFDLLLFEVVFRISNMKDCKIKESHILFTGVGLMFSSGK